MNRTIPFWQTAGFVLTSILGTFLHFLFDLSGENVAAALFSAVNESIWEHMKLIYYPMLLFALVEYRAWGKETGDFWCIKLKGILLALALIPAIYYLYTGALGISSDWFNITIFFIAAAAACRMETKMFQNENSCRIPSWLAFVLILLTGVVFTVLTFVTPRIPLFRDPVDGTYGFCALTETGSKIIMAPYWKVT